MKIFDCTLAIGFIWKSMSLSFREAQKSLELSFIQVFEDEKLKATLLDFRKTDKL